MKLAVKTELLKRVLSCTARAASTKAIQPILNNVLLSCDKGSLVVFATDLDLSIECKLPAEVNTPGKITLPAKKLEEIVSKVPGEDVNLSNETNNTLTKITSNKSKFQINGISPEEYPEILTKNRKDGITINIDSDYLLKGLSLTLFAATRYEEQSVLSGIKFVFSGKNLELAAADGSKIAVYSCSLEEKVEKGEAIIPFRAVVEIEKLIKTFKENNKSVSITIFSDVAIFENNDFTLITRLIDGKYPNYNNLIPKDLPYEATFSRLDLLNVLDRVSVLANEKTCTVKMSLEKKAKTVEVSAKSNEYGDSKDEIDVKYEGEDLQIAFNYKFLVESLRNLNVDKVTFKLKESNMPIILNLEEKDFTYTFLLMPVQLR